MTDNTPVRAIILVGGPTRGTRFRPLSLNIAKPLFPLAGKPMIYHHIEACKSELPGLREVLLLGTFPENVFDKFIEQTSEALNIKIEYGLQAASHQRMLLKDRRTDTLRRRPFSALPVGFGPTNRESLPILSTSSYCTPIFAAISLSSPSFSSTSPMARM